VRFRGSVATSFELERLFEEHATRRARRSGNCAHKWVSDRMDYGVAVEHLIWVRDHGRQAAAASFAPPHEFRV
jgi:hypothetical protein